MIAVEFFVMNVVAIRVYMLFTDDFMLMFRTCDCSGVLRDGCGSNQCVHAVYG